MKKRQLKALSLIMCLLMLAGATLIPVSAGDTTEYVTGTTYTGADANNLIKAYGLRSGTATDAEDGSNPDITAATLSGNASNRYLELDFSKAYDGTTGNKYPGVYIAKTLDDDNYNAMTSYTVEIDMIVCTSNGNKYGYVTYGGIENSTKSANFGFRTGAYVKSTWANGTIKGENLAVIAEKVKWLGEGDLAALPSATTGAVYTLEMTVDSTRANGNNYPYVTLKITDADGDSYTAYDGNATAVLGQSKIGVGGWYADATYGIDNIYVVNNATGEVVYNEDFEEERSVPTKDGCVFAGWYKDAAFTTPADEGADVGYPKFVSKDVLSVKLQPKAGATKNDASTDVRLITTVDGLDYTAAGFEITYGDKTVTRTSDVVYTSIKAMGDDYTPDKFCTDSKYFATFSITEIGNDVFGETITVTPVWVTADGLTVKGESVDFTVSALIDAQ